jgi:hypothetical protein
MYGDVSFDAFEVIVAVGYKPVRMARPGGGLVGAVVVAEELSPLEAVVPPLASVSP